MIATGVTPPLLLSIMNGPKERISFSMATCLQHTINRMIDVLPLVPSRMRVIYNEDDTQCFILFDFGGMGTAAQFKWEVFNDFWSD